MQKTLAYLKTNRFSEVKTQNGLFVLSALFIVGLLFSRALLSITPVTMLLWAVWQTPWALSIKQLRSNRPVLCLMGFYFLFLLSTFYTESWSQWLYFLTQYLPFLLIPLAWGLMPRLRVKQQYALLLLFVLLITILSIGTVIHYFLHRQEINTMIYHSQNPTSINGISHIYFGIFMALAVFFGIYLYFLPCLIWRPTEKIFILVCTIITFVSLHIMAFRTGLAGLYVTMLLQLIALMRNRKQYLLGGALLMAVILLPVSAYFTLESVQLRVANTQTDIGRYLHKEDINYYSISQRLAAWETALAVVQRNWLLGVAPADVKEALKNQYAVKDFNLKKENQIGIHNQYLNLLVSFGLPGFILVLYTFIYPLFRFNWLHHLGGTAFLMIVAVAMLVESVFQRQLGLNTFVFFYCLFFSDNK